MLLIHVFCNNNAAAPYANAADAEGIIVRGTNSAGQAISETIYFKNGAQAVGDQILVALTSIQ